MAETVFQSVYLSIRTAILQGEYSAGSRLKEETLAKRFQVSRTPIRAALQKLHAEGFLKFEPHHGAVIRRWSAKDVTEIFEIRAQLESLAAGLAASRAKAEDVAVLEDLCMRMEEAAGSPRTVSQIPDLNRTFHLKILEMSSNALLCTHATNFMDLGLLYAAFGKFSRLEIERSLSHHREILAAIRSGNSEWACSIMKAHVLAGGSVFAAGISAARESADLEAGD